MRDIRADLRDRIAALGGRESEIAREHNRRMRELELWWENEIKIVQDERSAAQAMLAIEMRRHGEIEKIGLPQVPLQDFIIQETAKRGIASKEDLRLAATQANYFPDGETGGRQIHTTVLNLVRANRLMEVQEGRFGVPGADIVYGPTVQMELTP